MAKKKTEAVDPNLDATVKEQIDTEEKAISEEKVGGENGETAGDGVEAPAEPTIQNTEESAKEEKADEKKGETKEKAVQGKDIPANVDKILKCFPNEKELYVDARGGVFVPGTKLSEKESAILYRNPYFKQ